MLRDCFVSVVHKLHTRRLGLINGQSCCHHDVKHLRGFHHTTLWIRTVTYQILRLELLCGHVLKLKVTSVVNKAVHQTEFVWGVGSQN